jgi:hypothetical protein
VLYRDALLPDSKATQYDMAGSAKIGERLIGRLIDENAANDPTRVWASIPVDNDDLLRGFRDINYGQFANAINHATWWLKGQLETKDNPETIAYAGPKDLRYPIIAVAALKLGKKVIEIPIQPLISLLTKGSFCSARPLPRLQRTITF